MNASGLVHSSGLVEDPAGALYGTTQEGGAAGNGTVFKINKDGNEFQALHDFTAGAADGAAPLAGLTFGRDGALYGTTSRGGGGGGGTVFKLQADGSHYQILHEFGPAPDGRNPRARLLGGSDGALYGTTSPEDHEVQSTIFKINQDGTGFQTLAQSGTLEPCDGCIQHYWACGLTEGADGALYGAINGITAAAGDPLAMDTAGDAKIFHVNKDGTGLREYLPESDLSGTGWIAQLVLAKDGLFYGTTSSGGDANGGTVFKLWPPQTPTVFTPPSSPESGLELRVSGNPGSTYQLLASSDLRAWTVLITFTMPDMGFLSYPLGPDGGSAVFYRAAWLSTPSEPNSSKPR